MGITIACIGSGNMGAALMQGAAGLIGGENLMLTDADLPKAAALAAKLGASVSPSNSEAARRGDFVFLAVKPQVLSSVLEELGAALKERFDGGKAPVLVSMAAGWSIEKIRGCLALPDLPVARIMPNTAALISRGMIALAASPEVGEARLSSLEQVLAAAGLVDRLEERYLDAVTGLSGSGPALVYLFIEALADGGVLAGLSRDKALAYAAQTVLGAAAMVRETGRHPGELKDMVCSPGGTSIAAVAALERGAFRGTVTAAVEAAWKRSLELGGAAPGGV